MVLALGSGKMRTSLVPAVSPVAKSQPGVPVTWLVCTVGLSLNKTVMQVWRNGRMFLTDPTQARMAAGYENWTPNDEDIAALKAAEAAMEQGEPTEDVTGDAPTADEPRDPDVVLDAGGEVEHRMSDAVSVMPPVVAPLSSPSEPPPSQVSLPSAGPPQLMSPMLTTPQLEVPTAASSPLPLPAAESEETRGVKRDPEPSALKEPESKFSRSPATLPKSFSRAVRFNQPEAEVLMANADGHIERVGLDGWEGNKATPNDFWDVLGLRDLPEVKHALPETTPQQVVLIAAVNAEETDDSDSDWLSDVTDVSANASTDLPSDDGDEEVLTRAQRKSLDRKIPWREILKLPESAQVQ